MGGNLGQNIRQLRPRIDTFVLPETMRLYMAATRCPPRSEPQNIHNFRPNAIPLCARSAALFDRQTPPSSRNRVMASQRLTI